MRNLLWRIFGPRTRHAGRDVSAAEQSGGQPGEETPAPPASRLTLVNRGLRDIEAVLDQQIVATRMLLDHVSAVSGCAAEAWQEREALLAGYYEVLRGVVRVLDDASAAAANLPAMAIVCQGLKEVLRQQGVEPIPLCEGDPFRPELHCCEETIDSADHPGGRVVRVVETGYVRHLADGAVVVVRPARVIVSKGK